MSEFYEALKRVEKTIEGSKGPFTDDLRTVLTGIVQAEQEIREINALHNECADENERLRDLLRQGIDLFTLAKEKSEGEADGARLLVWFETKYQTELAKWEAGSAGALKGGA
ncbi:hypothetical protein [Paremcibacter congregatus]|uniref:hypothetical protein n=1 Tax=Paremcibacter congregatus TaxID=2043170 RepID=UPI003A8CEABC